MIRDYDSKQGRSHQRQMMSSAGQRIADRLLADEEFSKSYHLRRESALVGVAIAFSGKLSRQRIRSIACVSNNRTYVNLDRIQYGDWENFKLKKRHHFSKASDGNAVPIIVAEYSWVPDAWITGLP